MLNKVKKWLYEHKWELVFVCMCFFTYLLWAGTMPFDSGPDEAMRFQIADFIYDHGYLPTGAEVELRDDEWGMSYGFTPILSYIFSSFIMKLVSFVTISPNWLLLAARSVSVLSSTITVIFLIMISKKCFNGLNQWVFVVFVALLPQFIFISSYVNNDAFAIMTTAIIFYSWILGLEKNWDLKTCVLLGIGISLCSLSYYNAYGFIFASIIIFLVTNLNPLNKNTLTKTMVSGLLITGIIIVLSGWWFLRNYIIHNGDILGIRTSAEFCERYAVESLKPSMRATQLKKGVSLLEMIFQRTFKFNWIDMTYLSFIGRFGQMKILLEEYMYSIYSTFYLIGLVGICFKIKERFVAKKVEIKKNTIKKVKWKKYMLYSCIFLTILIPVIISIYYSYTSDYQPQGRYVLPMIIPLSFLLTKGISQIKLVINKRTIPITTLIICTYIGMSVIIFCEKIAYSYF